jgi:hypothetical protein
MTQTKHNTQDDTKRNRVQDDTNNPKDDTNTQDDTKHERVKDDTKSPKDDTDTQDDTRHNTGSDRHRNQAIWRLWGTSDNHSALEDSDTLYVNHSETCFDDSDPARSLRESNGVPSSFPSNRKQASLCCLQPEWQLEWPASNHTATGHQPISDQTASLVCFSADTSLGDISFNTCCSHGDINLLTMTLLPPTGDGQRHLDATSSSGQRAAASRTSGTALHRREFYCLLCSDAVANRPGGGRGVSVDYGTTITVVHTSLIDSKTDMHTVIHENQKRATTSTCTLTTCSSTCKPSRSPTTLSSISSCSYLVIINTHLQPQDVPAKIVGTVALPQGVRTLTLHEAPSWKIETDNETTFIKGNILANDQLPRDAAVIKLMTSLWPTSGIIIVITYMPLWIALWSTSGNIFVVTNTYLWAAMWLTLLVALWLTSSIIFVTTYTYLGNASGIIIVVTYMPLWIALWPTSGIIFVVIYTYLWTTLWLKSDIISSIAYLLRFSKHATKTHWDVLIGFSLQTALHHCKTIVEPPFDITTFIGQHHWPLSKFNEVIVGLASLSPIASITLTDHHHHQWPSSASLVAVQQRRSSSVEITDIMLPPVPLVTVQQHWSSLVEITDVVLANSDWAHDRVDSRFPSPLWPTVTSSSTEAEYIAVSDASKEGVYVCDFFNELILINLLDNIGAAYIVRDAVNHNWVMYMNISTIHVTRDLMNIFVFPIYIESS